MAERVGVPGEQIDVDEAVRGSHLIVLPGAGEICDRQRCLGATFRGPREEAVLAPPWSRLSGTPLRRRYRAAMRLSQDLPETEYVRDGPFSLLERYRR
jgi:hypothetical protein